MKRSAACGPRGEARDRPEVEGGREAAHRRLVVATEQDLQGVGEDPAHADVPGPHAHARLVAGELSLDLYGMRARLKELGLTYVDRPEDAEP